MRIYIRYAVVATVDLVSRFERSRWRQAVGRERAVQHERTGFSRAVHDITVQSAYLIEMGIDADKAQAVDANPELSATLEAH